MNKLSVLEKVSVQDSTVMNAALQLQRTGDARWLREGLAECMKRVGQEDFRDVIVSLVLLRFAAESVGIDPRPYFDEWIARATPEMTTILRNARDHAPRDVRFTVAECGPPEWKALIGDRRYRPHP